MTISLELIGKNALVTGARVTTTYNNKSHECVAELGEARDSRRRFRLPLPLLMVNVILLSVCGDDSFLGGGEIQVF
jgi:hypothetical protein